MRLHLCLVGKGEIVIEEDIRMRTDLATPAAEITAVEGKIERWDAGLHRDDRCRTVIDACPALLADLCQGTYEAWWQGVVLLLDLSSKEGSP